MTEILTCGRCGLEGVPHEFKIIKMKRVPDKKICKICLATQRLNDKDKRKYLKKLDDRIRKKINKLHSFPKLPYARFAYKLTVDDKPIRHPDGSLIVKCTYCGKPFRPSFASIRNRIAAIAGEYVSGESRLYCSNGCKSACPVFNAITWPKGYRVSTSREVQAELRQIRLEIDNYKCQRCGVSIETAELHCHHITGVELNPIESADVDNTITLCKPCHKKSHNIADCGYHQLRCK